MHEQGVSLNVKINGRRIAFRNFLVDKAWVPTSSSIAKSSLSFYRVTDPSPLT